MRSQKPERHLDPTKLPRDAPPEAFRQRHLEFCKLCPPRKPKRHTN